MTEWKIHGDTDKDRKQIKKAHESFDKIPLCPEKVEPAFIAFLDIHCKCTQPSNLNEVNDLSTGLPKQEQGCPRDLDAMEPFGENIFVTIEN